MRAVECYVPLPLVVALNEATGSNEWQGDANALELLKPAIAAIRALAAAPAAKTAEERKQ